MDHFKRFVDWMASGMVAAFSVITLARIEAVVQISVGIATMAMCICAVRLSTLKRRAVKRDLERADYVEQRAEDD